MIWARTIYLAGPPGGGPEIRVLETLDGHEQGREGTDSDEAGRNLYSEMRRFRIRGSQGRFLASRPQKVTFSDSLIQASRISRIEEGQGVNFADLAKDFRRGEFQEPREVRARISGPPGGQHSAQSLINCPGPCIWAKSKKHTCCFALHLAPPSHSQACPWPPSSPRTRRNRATSRGTMHVAYYPA